MVVVCVDKLQINILCCMHWCIISNHLDESVNDAMNAVIFVFISVVIDVVLNHDVDYGLCRL